MGDTSPVRTSLIPSHSIHPSHLLFHRSLITISPHSDPPSCVLSAPPLLLLFFPFTSPPSPTLSTFSLPMGRAAEIRPCPNLVAPGRGKRTVASQCHCVVLDSGRRGWADSLWQPAVAVVSPVTTHWRVKEAVDRASTETQRRTYLKGGRQRKSCRSVTDVTPGIQWECGESFKQFQVCVGDWHVNNCQLITAATPLNHFKQ